MVTRLFIEIRADITSSSACPIINDPEGIRTIPRGAVCLNPLRDVAMISPSWIPFMPLLLPPLLLLFFPPIPSLLKGLLEPQLCIITIGAITNRLFKKVLNILLLIAENKLVIYFFSIDTLDNIET